MHGCRTTRSYLVVQTDRPRRTAGPLFVAGTPVKGGFYGEEPSPTDLDNGDLKPNGLSRRLVRPAGAHHRHRSHAVGRAGRTSVGFLG